ncbi:hypothetical protein B566_EDAN018276 [Ephemera danica]|nr:hypothetical protein B566_EDAN018276 [Ephemera danica]
MIKKIVEFFTSKVFLACLALLLAGLAIWFIGPMLAFDTLRPLATVTMRVTVIVLLLAFALFMLARLPVSVVGVTALCLLIWHAGPLLKLGSANAVVAPLSSETTRLLVIGVLVLLYLLWAIYRLIIISRNDPEKLAKYAFFAPKKEDKNLAEKDIKELNGIVNTAVAQLRRMRTGARGLARVFEGKRYLYELPWYMMIGNPGAGKTTALINSGLKFPLAGQMGEAAHGQRDTLKCTWWLTNQAVLIDTAGRYACHTEGGSGKDENNAEWHGFLRILRAQRPRAPINGVLATINVADLLNRTPAERTCLSADLRARLAELRDQLGIRFPVYVVLTKMDLITGFEAYFSNLSSEGRNQVWGFTLPYSAETEGVDRGNLRERCVEELNVLLKRLDAGVNTRLQEEFSLERRRELALLIEEFTALIDPIAQVVEEIFLDSRYDSTQIFTTLRGIYFTSAAQSPAALIADPQTLWQRLRRAYVGKRPEAENAAITATPTPASGNRSYFLHDLLTRLIFSEAHLVRPNLRWEFRFKLMRVIGHVLVVVIFSWLLVGMLTSAGNNHDYLQVVQTNSEKLLDSVKVFYAKPDNKHAPEVLDEAMALTRYHDLNPEQPPTSWTYGLYAAPPVVTAGNQAYATLADRLLLPFILRRMEAVAYQAIRDDDEKAAYAVLRVYLQMHEPAQYKANEVKAWVLADWEVADSAAAFGGKASMLWHIQKLFDGSRIVQSPFVRNEDMVAKARAMLDAKPSLTRVYERLKANMASKAPEAFTLTQAIGPQAGTFFKRPSGATLEEGISGLFTYEGYHELFQKELPVFLQAAYFDDAWVMGRRSGEQKKNDSETASRFDGNSDMAAEIRRLYLTEYTDHWEVFLGDIQALSGSTRAFNLQIMRGFASPDSPLVRLAKAVVKETTLTKPVSTGSDKTLLEKTQDQVAKKINEMTTQAGLRGSARMERQLVDNRFAALRAIVTGNADAASGAPAGGTGAPAAADNKAGLESINSLINGYYTQLVVADNALTALAIPPQDPAADKLRMEAAKLPAPFRGILLGLVTEGTRGLNAGVGEILISQADASVGEFCRKAIQGKYPFGATNEQEVDVDDFVRLFGVGGLMDEFFTKHLETYVDSAAKPWRYKSGSPDMPPIAGPSLESFARARQIRDTFFRDPSSKKMLWKADIRVIELDPMITDFTLDFDGQVQRYIHGPVMPWNITWPGPRGGVQAEAIANPKIKSDTSTLNLRGAWAIFRLFDKGRANTTGNSGKTTVDFEFDGRHALVEINAGTLPNPISSDLLTGFKCPGRSA